MKEPHSVRLHSLFSLGPDFMYEQLTREHHDRDDTGAWPTEEEFKQKLTASSAVLAAFVDSQESRLANLLATEIMSLDDWSGFTPNSFNSPTSSQYEMTLTPILNYGDPFIPQRRRR